jgi:glycosyltransferase involved in cell wall biosynthesis
MVKRRVVILYKYMQQYRVPFFTRLHRSCLESDIQLEVLYGNPGHIDALRADHAEFALGTFVKNRFLRVRETELVWQPVLSQIRGSDLVIVEQANKLLINYLLIARQLLGVQKFAFWGHGKNLQAKKSQTLSEQLKRWMARSPHWWFAYTEATARYIEALGFPAHRITTVYNAVETSSLVKRRSEITEADIENWRKAVGIQSKNICLYVGSMYPEKRIEFLLVACKRIRERVSDFSMIFIGAGPDEDLVRKFCSENSWAVYAGPVFGDDRMKYSSIARLLLLPGAVGLAILDAFAMRVPIVTMEMPFHGPEIEYLNSGWNGLMVELGSSIDGYVSAVVGLLKDSGRLDNLARNCHQSANIYTVENMANHFFEGIRQALVT